MLRTNEHRPFMTSPSAAARYFDKMRQLQQAGAQLAVVTAKGHPEQWAAWISYYRARSLWGMLELMQDRPNGWTVPTLDPADFEVAVAEIKPDRRTKE